MKTFKKILREWIVPFGLEIIVVLLILKFAFFFATVPTGSMIPTIPERSWLFVTRMYAPEKTVQRGDIVVFYSDELGETLVKRAVGLPGDNIAIDENGDMTVNGREFTEGYVLFPSETSGEWDVPDGCYLFMGDNRAESFDARLWQSPYIPADKLMGEARFALWPLSNFGPLN